MSWWNVYRQDENRVWKMSSEIVECCEVAKNKAMICASRSCQKNHAETFERRYYLSGVKVD